MTEAISSLSLCQVTEGDCLEIMKKIPSGSINCVIADPPYFIGYNSSVTEGGRQDWGNHTLLTPLFDSLFSEFVRVLRKDGRAFVFTDWRTYPTLYLSASKYARVSNLIVWDYGWIKAGLQFRFTHELILHATMPDAKSPKNRSTSDVWRLPPINFTVDRHHPAEKPVEIIEKMLIETSEQGDIIPDPFLGSGTTAIACEKLGCKWIGIEINPEHCATAKKRIEPYLNKRSNDVVTETREPRIQQSTLIPLFAEEQNQKLESEIKGVA